MWSMHPATSSKRLWLMQWLITSSASCKPSRYALHALTLGAGMINTPQRNRWWKGMESNHLSSRVLRFPVGILNRSATLPQIHKRCPGGEPLNRRMEDGSSSGETRRAKVWGHRPHVELGCGDGTRTHDLLVMSQTRFHLRYSAAKIKDPGFGAAKRSRPTPPASQPCRRCTRPPRVSGSRDRSERSAPGRFR